MIKCLNGISTTDYYPGFFYLILRLRARTSYEDRNVSCRLASPHIDILNQIMET